MGKEIRRKRSIELYMKLKEIIGLEYVGNYGKLKILYDSVEQNITTTQMNQINIALKINEEKYLKEVLE